MLVVIAVGVSLLLLFGVRPLVKRQLLDGEVDHGIGASGLVGREARVLQAVTDTDGRIKLAGETWSARLAEGSTTVGPGGDVRVIAIEGATAIVVPRSARSQLTGAPSRRREVDPMPDGRHRPSSSWSCWWPSSSSCSSGRSGSSRSRPPLIVERLGRYSRTLDGGLHFLVPFVDSCAPTSTCASRSSRSRRSR